MSEVIRPAAEIDRAIESLLCRGAEVHLLNTTIVPPGADGLWRIAEVDISYVAHILSWLGHSGAYGFLHSHIGHESTAQIASELLRQRVDVDRRPWNGEGIGVAIQLNGRPPEGKILSREEVEAIGYTLRLVFLVEKEEAQTAKAFDSVGPFTTPLEGMCALVEVLAPFLDLHSRGAQGARLYEQFDGFKARLYLTKREWTRQTEKPTVAPVTNVCHTVGEDGLSGGYLTFTYADGRNVKHPLDRYGAEAIRGQIVRA